MNSVMLFHTLMATVYLYDRSCDMAGYPTRIISSTRVYKWLVCVLCQLENYLYWIIFNKRLENHYFGHIQAVKYAICHPKYVTLSHEGINSKHYLDQSTPP